MNKVDPLRNDDALQAAHIERHRERVLGRRREADEETANRLQLGRQLVGIARHQRPGAGFRQRGGDGERRAFVAARGERRDDLEDRTAGERRVGPRPKGESASTLMAAGTSNTRA